MPESTDFAPLLWIGLFAAGGLILFFFLIFVVKQYKRCPSNRILVIYGRVGGQKAAKCRSVPQSQSQKGRKSA